ncbi:MAG TPA: serine hydrolase domain-containing protein [Gemmatimonadaceae bacterium]|nr:serine hydrolase domain-containing protein [Gemmatimonadaceae bacterium]
MPAPARRHPTASRLVALLTLVAAALVPGATDAQSRRSPTSPPRARRAAVVARVDSLALAWLREFGLPGVSIAVVRGGRDTVVAKGYGLADIENAVPVTAQSVFEIGSVTKQFTSSLVMRLVERGELSLDDSLGALLPTVPPAWRGVRLRQLLNHTSGIPSYTDIGERWTSRIGEDMTPDTLIALTARDSMNFAPGSSWRYDNTGYVLVGMLLEKRYGRPYADLVAEQLATPLGLRATRYCRTDSIVAHRAHGYGRVKAGLVNAPYLSMTQPFSAGALCATASDLARWNYLLATGKVVSAASYQRMTSPEGGALTAPLHYGYGLAVDTVDGHPRVVHGGGIFGFISANAYYPADSLSVTVLSNAAPSNPDLLLKNVARVVLGLQPRGSGATSTH